MIWFIQTTTKNSGAFWRVNSKIYLCFIINRPHINKISSQYPFQVSLRDFVHDYFCRCFLWTCIFPPKNIANNLSKKFLQPPSLLYKRSLDGSKNIRTHRRIHIQTYTQAYNEIWTFGTVIWCLKNNTSVKFVLKIFWYFFLLLHSKMFDSKE